MTSAGRAGNAQKVSRSRSKRKPLPPTVAVRLQAPRCPKGHIRLSTDPEGCVVCEVQSGKRLGWPSEPELPASMCRESRERAAVRPFVGVRSVSTIARYTGLSVERVRELLRELSA